jgi:hypothetical protein
MAQMKIVQEFGAIPNGMILIVRRKDLSLANIKQYQLHLFLNQFLRSQHDLVIMERRRHGKLQERIA